MDEARLDSCAAECMQRRSSMPVIPVTLAVVVAAVFYAAMGALAEWSAFRGALSSIPTGVWFQLVALSLCSYGARFLRWHGFLGRLGCRVPARRSLEIYLSGFAMTLTPGKAGELIRSVYLRQCGVGYPESIGAFIAERLLDLFAVGVLASLMLGAVPDQQSPIWGVLAVCVGFVLIFRLRLLDFMTVRLRRKSFGVQGAAGVDVVKFLFFDVRVVGAAALSILAWAAQGLSLYLIVHSLGYDLSILGVIGIYCMSILAGAASFIPGGLGATELAILYALRTVGLEVGDATAASLVSRGVTLWLAVVVGVIATGRIALGARRICSRCTTE